jgi:hypothetical protein
VSNQAKLFFITFLVGTLLLSWFVHRTIYVNPYGNRPWLAAGCTALVVIVCLAAGFYLLIMSAIVGG